MKQTLHSIFEKVQIGQTYYYVHLAPHHTKRILVSAGLHGNEAGVIEPLFTYFQQHPPQSTSIIFIPKMSPSAIQHRQRSNGNGNDANRIFDTLDDLETVIVKHIIQKHAPYDLAISFHEDLEYSEVYLYEVSEHRPSLTVRNWQQGIKNLGLTLLNGIDDPNDSTLQLTFVDGYNFSLPDKHEQFEDWIVSNHFAQKSFTVEVPAKTTKIQKEQIVEMSLKLLGEVM